jgi:hypothetical protein
VLPIRLGLGTLTPAAPLLLPAGCGLPSAAAPASPVAAAAAVTLPLDRLRAAGESAVPTGCSSTGVQAQHLSARSCILYHAGAAQAASALQLAELMPPSIHHCNIKRTSCLRRQQAAPTLPCLLPHEPCVTFPTNPGMGTKSASGGQKVGPRPSLLDLVVASHIKSSVPTCMLVDSHLSPSVH